MGEMCLRKRPRFHCQIVTDESSRQDGVYASALSGANGRTKKPGRFAPASTLRPHFTTLNLMRVLPPGDCTTFILSQPHLVGFNAVEGPQAAAEEHRHDVHVQLVRQPGFQALLGRPGAADDVDIFVPAAFLACLTALAIPSVTKVKVTPPASFGCLAGTARVTTNSGTWYS